MADSWDSALYDDRHSFVWKGSADLIELLDPQPAERILDLGCGTGHLTSKIAARGAEVMGLDSSPSMIAQARQNFPKLRFMLGNAASFHFDTPFQAVFSNAALHWVKDAEAVIECIRQSLHRGGRFVLEMGAKGNIAHIIAGVEEVLQESGYPATNPWYFPSLAEYSALLERRGFEVRQAQTFPRWNKLEHPDRGLSEWLEMFGGSYFEAIPAGERQEMGRRIEERLRPALRREGAWWADYRRLRVRAEKL